MSLGPDRCSDLYHLFKSVLEELRENNSPLSKGFKLLTPMKNCGSYDSWKKSIFKREQDSSVSNAPPNKINGVISSTAGNTMTPESKLMTTKFSLPEDWFMKNVPRKSGKGFDKYYYDPETGHQFRSLKEVERYLTHGFMPNTTRSKSKMPKYHEKMQDFGEDKDNICQLINVNPKSFLKLPDGWFVKEVPRKASDHIDRYYYEPGTGRMFRSLTSVQKHLAQLEEESSPLSAVLQELRENNFPLSKAFKFLTPMKNYCSYDSWKKSLSKKDQDSSFSNAPPNKINWVIPSTAVDIWDAFVGDELVPDSMKQQWGQRFMLTINNTKHNELE